MSAPHLLVRNQLKRGSLDGAGVVVLYGKALQPEMAEQRTYCNGRYRVRTVPTEMRMSHWLNAPVVERVSDGAVLLDLSEDVWDLWEVGEEGDILVLVIRKYPGHTNGVEVRILPEPDQYQIGDKVTTQEALISALRALP